jgi:flagellar biosynthetic protein FliO
MKVMGYLFLVLFIFYIFAKYLRTNVENIRRSKYIEVIDSVAVSQKVSLQVAKVAGKTYLVGVSDAGINLIDHLDEEKLEENKFEKKDFAALFKTKLGKEDSIEKD